MQYLVKTPYNFKVVQGESVALVKNHFLEEGIVINFIIPWPFDLNRFKFNAGLNDKQCYDLFFQLANLMRSTGSIGTSINILYDRMNMSQNTNLGFTRSKIKSILRKLAEKYYRDKFKKLLYFLRTFREEISKGVELPKIFADNNFNEVVLTLLKASAEKTGDYVIGFEKCTEFFETKRKYRKGLIDTLAYPAMLFVALYGSFLVLTFYAMPMFAIFFKNFHGIAKSTLFIINLFTFLKQYYFYYTGIFIFALVIFYYLFILDKYRIKTRFFNKLAQVPVLGSLFQFEFLRYFSYEFGTLIASGETPQAIMKFFMSNTKNSFYKQKIGLAYDHVVYGYSLWESFQIAEFLRPQDIYFIAAAETSGSLDSAFLELSKTYELAFDLEVKIFRQVLQGVFFAIIICFILFIFTGVYLPMIEGMISLH